MRSGPDEDKRYQCYCQIKSLGNVTITIRPVELSRPRDHEAESGFSTMVTSFLHEGYRTTVLHLPLSVVLTPDPPAIPRLPRKDPTDQDRPVDNLGTTTMDVPFGRTSLIIYGLGVVPLVKGPGRKTHRRRWPTSKSSTVGHHKKTLKTPWIDQTERYRNPTLTSISIL